MLPFSRTTWEDINYIRNKPLTRHKSASVLTLDILALELWSMNFFCLKFAHTLWCTQLLFVHWSLFYKCWGLCLGPYTYWATSQNKIKLTSQFNVFHLSNINGPHHWYVFQSLYILDFFVVFKRKKRKEGERRQRETGVLIKPRHSSRCSKLGTTAPVPLRYCVPNPGPHAC